MIGIGLLKGLKVTQVNFFRFPATIQYPNKRVWVGEYSRYHNISPIKLLFNSPKNTVMSFFGMAEIPVKIPQSPRFRGNEFAWFEDRCTGCASCAKYCPLGIIEIVTSPGSIDIQEGESYSIDVFDIDIGRCRFCGLCVEACPYDALHMGTTFERSTNIRNKLVISKDELNNSLKKPSSWYRPQLEERNFNPFDSDIDDHYEAGRHEKPEDKEMKNKWVDRS